MFKSNLTKPSTFFDLLNLSRSDRKMIRNLKSRKIQIRGQQSIYVESLQTPMSNVALSIFLPTLSRYLKSPIISYKFAHLKWYSRLTQKLIHYFSPLYAIGARKIDLFVLRNNGRSEYEKEFGELLTKRELLNYTYRGIHIGDLIYDSYLNECHKPTVDFSDLNLYLIFSDCCAIVDKWIANIEKKKISAVVVGHAVYKNGIPARVCLNYGLPAYQVNLSSIYSLTPSRPLAHFDFLDFPELFSKLSDEMQKKALKIARQRLEKRLSGDPAPELIYLPVSAHGKITGDEPRLLKETNNFKVLIATHDFYDSPHCNAETLYEDFYTWLEAIGEIAEKTSFDWYIKNHPYLRGDGEAIVSGLIDRFPKITILPPETSHQQLVREGINAVLTVYGTIGSEYAYRGLKVVNACEQNPHSAYNFNFNPKSISEFENTIKNLDTAPIQIDNKEIEEYFYMAYLHYPTSWLFPDCAELTSILTEQNIKIQKKMIYDYANRTLTDQLVGQTSNSILKALRVNNYRLDSSIPRR